MGEFLMYNDKSNNEFWLLGYYDAHGDIQHGKLIYYKVVSVSRQNQQILLKNNHHL